METYRSGHNGTDSKFLEAPAVSSAENVRCTGLCAGSDFTISYCSCVFFLHSSGARITLEIYGELSERSKVRHSKCRVPKRNLGFESLTLRHKKPVNKPVYRLFNFCLKGKARTIFGFQGRKSAVLPGTDRTPAAAEVAALRQSKPCLHRLRRSDLGLVIQVGVDVRRGGKVAVPQPLLNVFEGDAVGQQQAGTAVPLRYNYDKPEKPRISRVFGYLARFFILFQTEKSSREVVIS